MKTYKFANIQILTFHFLELQLVVFESIKDTIPFIHTKHVENNYIL